MKKTKTKPKANQKEKSGNPSRGQVVRLKQAKARPGLSSKLPPIKLYWTQARNFVVEAVQELKKTTWPNRKETLTTTGVVIVLVFFIAAYLGLVDFLLVHFIRFFIH
ncbi:MAG: preprotein translocase subunit SecE [Deltaproteobacteria bacterium]|jgi:preprotein translocase subunit SecE